ncbi:MAG: hypothetical protein LBN07_04890 [Christensenellaceae bacterium]|jgi:hypothetical protein|nr:hypothetical protein [Christensenellaceae bacterium]
MTDNKFIPMSTEEKREFGKQFSSKEKMSYRKGQRSAYSHMSNAARRQSIFISDNLPSNNKTPPKKK